MSTRTDAFSVFCGGHEIFFGSQGIGLKGLRLPVREEELLDAEFANDTTVYLQGGQHANLAQFSGGVREVLRCFGCQD